MTNNFHSALKAVRNAGYRGFFSSVFNVEGGQASIADERMPSCDECFDAELPAYDCKACGRTKSNFIKFRAGEGDGIYAVMDLCIPGKEPLGGMLIFNRDIVGGMLGMVADGSPQIFDLDFSEVMDDMEGVCIGNLKLLGGSEDNIPCCFYVGDAGADNSGQYALPFFFAKPGEYSVVLFGSREAVLILPRERLSEFGLTEKHDLNEVEIGHYALGSPDDLVMSHMNPAGSEAVLYNVELNMFIPDEGDEVVPMQIETFVSWVMQLDDIAPDLLPAELAGFLDVDAPADELLNARIESASARGYISPRQIK
jgi:hypothetical protein